MTTESATGLHGREAREGAVPAEATRPGALLVPPVDIFEDAQAITVLADMPGVRPAQLTIDLHEGVLTMTGHADAQGGPTEVVILREYPVATFQRSFTLSEAIDQQKIEASLKNGVLRLRLPKAERARPRQITIQTE
jgi:HSP20 family protein